MRGIRAVRHFLICAQEFGMRSLIKPACLFVAAASLCAATAPARIPAYAVLSEEAGAWPQILESVGFQAVAPGQARIFVIRPQTAASTGWTERVEQGAVVILEGQ